jgi:S1-C subfamily serine protease
MTWTQLNYKPQEPEPLGLKDQDPGQKQLEDLGGFMKAMALLMGKKPAPPPLPRGFLGVELADRDGIVTVAKVLKKTPAAAAGLQKGDRISDVQGQGVKTSVDVLRLAARVTAGETVRLTVVRGDDTKEITVTAGEGL